MAEMFDKISTSFDDKLKDCVEGMNDQIAELRIKMALQFQAQPRNDEGDLRQIETPLQIQKIQNEALDKIKMD